MSEYQYYEFVALDQALTAKQQGELRAVSSRGRITSSGFVNDYQWGDLKADPAKWMERYFVAHLHLANWGTRRIMLRLLAAIVPVRTELAGGDRRLLYLAWLLYVQNRELDDDEPKPPVPAGLATLSGPLRALADFLRLDPDLLDAAAAASRPLTEKEPSAAALRRWVKALPMACWWLHQVPARPSWPAP